MFEVKSGKDRLLYEDDYCYIVENGNTHLRIRKKVFFAKRRISFNIKQHKQKISSREMMRVKQVFSSFLWNSFQWKLGEDYFLQVTMGTYKDHFHIHAYVPPFTDRGIIK